MVRTPLRLSLAVLAIAVSPAVASVAQADGVVGSITTSLIGGNCGTTSTVFARWGDSHNYYLVPDGGFESGGTGWTLTDGARVVEGNESFHVHAASDTSSLLVPRGGSATSPAICFGLLNPGVRLFATSSSGPASVHVQLIARGLLGILSVLDGGSAPVGPAWAPTPVFSTTFSQLNVPVGTKTIQLVITATGNVQIDDLYIDPFTSH